MIVINNFEDYLNSISNRINNKNDMKYYNMVTKPLFEELSKIANSRLLDIEQRVKDTYNHTITQSRLMIAEVSVNDIKQFDGTEPVVNINSNVDYVEQKNNIIHFKDFKVKQNSEIKLFSFIYNVDYNEFIGIANRKLSAVLTDKNGNTYNVILFQKINTDYIETEARLKKLIINNKLNDIYFPIPICRRIIDVYINTADYDFETINMIALSDSRGKVKIPLWNITKHQKTISKRTCSPYSKNSKRNIYVGEIDLKNNMVIDCLAESVNPDKKFLYSEFSNGKIHIYSENKDIFKKDLNLYYISEIQNKTFENLINYSSLKEVNLDKFSKDYISEGIIMNIVNSLAPVTNYELENIQCEDNNIIMELIKVENKFYYDYEMKQFIVNTLQSHYPKYNFKVSD